MNKMKRSTRLCWSCEGDVSFDAVKCPFCGVDLDVLTETESVSSPEETPLVADPAFAVTVDEWNQALEQDTGKEESSSNEAISLLLLLPGVVFFLFGLTLLFFAEGGMLQLQWKADFAYFYFVGALPLLFFGWRNLNKN
jgi:hypothetical protein